MKKISIFLIQLFFTFSFWGLDIPNKTINGEFFYKGKAIPTYLYIEENEYRFEVANAKNKLSIPEAKIEYDGYYIEKGRIQLISKDGLDYFSFISNDTFQLFPFVGVLSFNNLLFLCQENKVIFDSLFSPKEQNNFPYYENFTVQSSSFLQENEIIYDGTTFGFSNRDLIPWIEGSPNEGINEWIELHIQDGTNIDSLLISNGYVNFSKSYLYYANNRVKALEIVCNENDLNFTALLQDTSEFQLIKLPKNLPKGNCTLQLTIKDIYKGNKWNDTCINRIILSNSKLIK